MVWCELVIKGWGGEIRWDDTGLAIKNGTKDAGFEFRKRTPYQNPTDHPTSPTLFKPIPALAFKHSPQSLRFGNKHHISSLAATGTLALSLTTLSAYINSLHALRMLRVRFHVNALRALVCVEHAGACANMHTTARTARSH